eukprot:TRINITY_DN30421_c0_g2_i1.p1 TRINITY_DN30421_c0_g2~~TRINITY_DN30421_c0_g2_i1.p1  ORF type:complete len:897 (+),score=170.53 TRINITY_DN30421_c0_g2_i1:82-2772(+)
MTSHARICEKGGGGLAFPLFGDDEQEWPPGLRAVLYALGLLYCFMGVNVISDHFMNSIEMITSARKRVYDKRTHKSTMAPVWNPTVANLTLLALGSSAPEILLSVVDSVKEKHFASSLGPGTIVGSAAFNLLVIVPVCMFGIESDQVRYVKEYNVFIVTAVFSLVAYLWLWVMVDVSSPQVIEVWEAIVTLGCMPVLVFVAYVADVAGQEKEAENEARALKAQEAAAFAEDHQVHPKARRSMNALNSQLKKIEDHDNHEPKKAAPDPTSEIVRDERGKALVNPAGILTFGSSSLDFDIGTEPRVCSIPIYRRNGWTGQVSCRYKTERMTAMPGADFQHMAGIVEFEEGQKSVEIQVMIMPKRAHEKNDCFIVKLEGPSGGAQFDPSQDGGEESNLLYVTLLNMHAGKGGQAFSSRVMALREDILDQDRLGIGMRLWKEQIISAIKMDLDDGDDEGGEEDADDGPSKPSVAELVVAVLSYPWNVCYAVLNPPSLFGGGWVLFGVALLHIACITTLVADLASLLGCVCKVDDTITAITIVALGTSLPDLFASQSAALQDEYADASIVNVTGSNSVNVFLGIGVPWLQCSLYWSQVKDNADWTERFGVGEYAGQFQPGQFVVVSHGLQFAVVVFLSIAVMALVAIRWKRVIDGGELGGPLVSKVAVGSTMIFLWCLYILMMILYWESRAFAVTMQYILVTLACVFIVVAIAFEGLVFLDVIKPKPLVPVGGEEEDDETKEDGSRELEIELEEHTVKAEKLNAHLKEHTVKAEKLNNLNENISDVGYYHSLDKPKNVEALVAPPPNTVGKRDGPHSKDFSMVIGDVGGSDVRRYSDESSTPEVFDFQVNPKELALAKSKVKAKKRKKLNGQADSSIGATAEGRSERQTVVVRPVSFVIVD